METQYVITVKKVITGERLKREYSRMFDSDHPKAKTEAKQYDHVESLQPFSDSETVFEVKTSKINLSALSTVIFKEQPQNSSEG